MELIVVIVLFAGFCGDVVVTVYQFNVGIGIGNSASQEWCMESITEQQSQQQNLYS